MLLQFLKILIYRKMLLSAIHTIGLHSVRIITERNRWDKNVSWRWGFRRYFLHNQPLHVKTVSTTIIVTNQRGRTEHNSLKLSRVSLTPTSFCKITRISIHRLNYCVSPPSTHARFSPYSTIRSLLEINAKTRKLLYA